MNEIFLKNIENEFQFLKDSNYSLKSGYVLDVNDLGYLVPLNSDLGKNKELISNFGNWEFTSNQIELNYFTEVLSHPNQINFLVCDRSFEFKGLISVLVNVDDTVNLIVENSSFDFSQFELFISGLKSLKTWATSVLFVENFFLKILKNKESIANRLLDSNFEIVESDDIVIKMKLLYDKPIGHELILTAGPSIGSREKVFALDAASKGWNNEWNKYLKEFENKFAEYIGVKYAIATSSCTGAMHIGLMALNLKKEDEVIVPDITWVATANAVLLAGATPVFADIDIKTWKIDIGSIKKLINKNTKAIMPVHLYGNPCDMDEIMKIAKENNLYVIEDAAPSIGAEFNGKKTGSFGHFSAFSFQGAKLAVTGEGGMLCTNDDELYKKAYRIWDQGRIPGTFWIEELGLKYKMSNIQAALGLGQLLRNDAMVEAKRRINNWYRERLIDVESIDFWVEDHDTKSIYWMSNIRLNDKANISRDEFFHKLREFNIDTRPVFPAISQYPYWPNKQKPQPSAKIVGDTGINLPSGVSLTRDHINYICDKIIKILSHEK